MALKGKFTVNDANYSPLLIYGIGTFMAYSGNREYRNRAGCIAVPDNGPIPEGVYHIVKRPTDVSLGCITLQHRTDFIAIRQALLYTPQINLPNGLMSYGTIEVFLNGSKTCPGGV